MERTLMAFVNTLDQSLKRSLKGAAGLTISQLQYLEAIHGLGRPTISEVASRLGFTKASVTAGVNKLVALGYVAKVQSAEDKRVFHVETTESAKTLVGAKQSTIAEYVGFIKEALTPEELAVFERILAKLVGVFADR